MNTYLFCYSNWLGWIRIHEINGADSSEENLIAILRGSAKRLGVDAPKPIGVDTATWLLHIMKPFRYKIIQANNIQQAIDQLGEISHGF